ncbi:PREDICTED: coiled-coil domain-containing protein 170 [Elephantulus edwardii]|uniref:coiled-coil domain-containing protein 170 n=1 Tax=Elephantulus edwardii TaxID=28737 RepID=UPI0003F084D8|nr:PREDICTED: coiled-coil domain-containing protein 170 [Elephantulus edwardii]
MSCSDSSSSGSRLRDQTSDTIVLGASSPSEPEETYNQSAVPVTREQLNHYRDVAENVQSELAATLVKLDRAQTELRELRSKMLSKEVSCQELKAEMESYKENNARKSSLLTSLRDRVQELEGEVAALTTSKIRIEITAHAAVKENQVLKKKVIELEEKLQKCLKEKEENKIKVSETCRKQEDFLSQLHDCLELDMKNGKASEEDLILKLRALCKENASARGQLVTLEETVNVHEMEAKASRETILRLAEDVNRQQEQAASCLAEKAQLSQDLLRAVEAKDTLEKEAKVFQERLLAGQRVWDALKQEMNHLKKSSSELEKSLKASLDKAAASQSQYDSFRQEITGLLQGSWGVTGATEAAILERIRDMSAQEEKRKKMVSQLEAQIAKLVEQLGKETKLHQKALQRAQKAETKLEVLQGQLAHLEGELVSGDFLRDNLNFEKQKYLKFLDQLSEKMKLDQMAAELGFDMRLDVVLARTEQLVRLESHAVIENKTIAYNLQRKLKTQKERLESKELHMALLRQKIAQLQEEKQVRTALAVERDEATVTIRKLEKKVERLQKELSASREANMELKAKLADTNELKIKTLEQTKTIEDLGKSRDKLEKLKEKAEKQLLSVRAELDSSEHEAKEHKERARSMMDVVASEVKTLRKSLEEAEKREKQLTDFKEVVSQMLGLKVTSLALPDYEIIKCLERLIHSQQHHLVTCACLKGMIAGRDRHPQEALKPLH